MPDAISTSSRDDEATAPLLDADSQTGEPELDSRLGTSAIPTDTPPPYLYAQPGDQAGIELEDLNDSNRNRRDLDIEAQTNATSFPPSLTRRARNKWSSLSGGTKTALSVAGILGGLTIAALTGVGISHDTKIYINAPPGYELTAIEPSWSSILPIVESESDLRRSRYSVSVPENSLLQLSAADWQGHQIQFGIKTADGVWSFGPWGTHPEFTILPEEQKVYISTHTPWIPFGWDDAESKNTCKYRGPGESELGDLLKIEEYPGVSYRCRLVQP